MTFKEAKEIFLNRGYEQVDGGSIYNPDKWRESVIVISDWLQQEPCEDCISRHAIEEMIKAEMPERGMWEIEGDKEKETVCEVCVDLMQKLSELPPITTQPKTGHWIEHPHEAGTNWEYSRYECSECHVWEDDDSDFCPNCGAKME